MSPSLPGRLSDRTLKLSHDPRLHPKLASTLSLLGLDGSRPDVFSSMSLEELSSPAFLAQSHAGMMRLYDILPLALPSDDSEPEIEVSSHEFTSRDGRVRELYVFRRADLPSPAEGPEGGGGPGAVPAVVYLHGGAMTLGDTTSPVHLRWVRSLAARGVVGIALDFRNAWTEEGSNPFPTGLDDCVAGVRYVIAHRRELGVGKVVVQGESGGANLALATALRAKREGWVGEIAGVVGVVPFVSNGYGWEEGRKLRELPSLVENDGYFLLCKTMEGLSRHYAPHDGANPLAWPLYATTEELKGLPPHRLVMDELDPLRDEGMAYYRKLVAAGVDATASVNLGTVHASGLVFRQLLPELYNEMIRGITEFAKGL